MKFTEIKKKVYLVMNIWTVTEQQKYKDTVKLKSIFQDSVEIEILLCLMMPPFWYR